MLSPAAACTVTFVPVEFEFLTATRKPSDTEAPDGKVTVVAFVTDRILPRSERTTLSLVLMARDGIDISSFPPTLTTLFPGVLIEEALAAAAVAEFTAAV